MAAREEEPAPLCIVVVPDGDETPFPGLESQLSLERREALAATLLVRAREWAGALDGGQAQVATPSEVKRLIDGRDRVVLLRPALTRYGNGQADDLLDDFRHGCGLVIGPTLAGGWYLLGLSPARSDLLEAAADGGPGTAGSLIAAARAGGGVEAGLLRAERDLIGPGDLAAAKADPLLDIELASLLG